jgi:hypothetical protein
MVDLPSNLKLTKEEYFERFKDDVTTASNGRLFDFSPSSVLTILGEAQASSIARLVDIQAQLIPYIAANVIENLGFMRSKGTFAICTVRFLLSNIFDREYIILRGTRFQIGNGVVFATQNDLVIPANTDTSDPLQYQYCSVDAIAVEIGSKANQAAQKAIIVQVYPELDSIWLDEPSRGGNDEETPDQFFDRVSILLAKLLETQFSLIQPSEFELAVEGTLGNGSIAVAIPDVSFDGSLVQVASMNVFAINPDGSALNSAQIRSLSADIGTRAPLVGGRLYFNSLTLPLVDIDISIKVASTDDSIQLSDSINNKVRETFTIAKTKEMESLELYELIFQVKLLGALTPVARWGYVGDILQARDLPLVKIVTASDKKAPVKINTLRVIIEPNNFIRTYT